ncbi:MAG: type II toxin-antitoxin system HicB family antitoxin [Nitrosopumilus sp.]
MKYYIKKAIVIVNDVEVVIESQYIGWTAHVPSMKGCISQGETFEGTISNIANAMILWGDKDEATKE